MKIVFFGTPEFAREFLSAVVADRSFDVVGVVAQPDAPVGRKQILTPPPTKVFALEHSIPVLAPEKLKDESFKRELEALGADAFLVVAYGKIIPQEIIDLPRLGTLNVHPSLLPKYRGPSPIQSAIAAGEKTSGVTVMKIDAKMDHGPILAQAPITIEATETPETYRQKAVLIGAPLLIDAMKRYADGSLTPTPQDDAQATVCKLLTRDNGKIDWSASGETIEARIRGFSPWPGTWTVWQRNEKELTLKILKAQLSSAKLDPGVVSTDGDRLLIGTGSLALDILELQPEGGRAMDSQTFLRGYKDIQSAGLR